MRDGGETLGALPYDAALDSGPALEAVPVAPPSAYTNRYEIKYLVETHRLGAVRAAIGGFFVEDTNGDPDGGYVNYSIYFDSPDYRFYSEKREGELIRIKPRIRLYRPATDAQPSAIYLELKARYDRIVAKRRVAIDARQAERLMQWPSAEPSARELENSVLAEFHYLCHRFVLRPCVTVMYHRTAFNGAFHSGLRMTFDRVLQCSLATTLDNPADSFVPALSPTWTVVEIKYNDRISDLLLDRLHGLGLQQHTFSKYGVAMEQCHETFRQYLAVH